MRNPIDDFFQFVFLLALFFVVVFISSAFVSETWAMIFGGIAIAGFMYLCFYAESSRR